MFDSCNGVLVLAVPSKHEIIFAELGSSDNLLAEDINEGYVGYFCFSQCSIENGANLEDIADGGMMLFEQDDIKRLKDPDTLAWSLVNYIYEEDLPFQIIFRPTMPMIR